MVKRVHLELTERFWQKVQKSEPSECWEWQAGKSGDGYGMFSIGSRTDGTRKRAMAHRISYQLAHSEPIPQGMEIDHLCRNRLCVNPGHLQVVSHRDNTLRGQTIMAFHAQQTHCV